MAASTTEPASSDAFPLFPFLPYELRHQIWNDTLPEAPSCPSLYFYRERGLWRPFDVPETDPDYIPRTDNLGFRFCTELLDPLDNQIHPLSLALVGVNREARRVALKWIDEHGIQCSLKAPPHNLTTGSHLTWQITLSRPFQRAIDALYIPHSKWHGFCLEPIDRGCEPDLIWKTMGIYGSELQHIAIPQSLLADAELIIMLPETIQQWVYNVHVVYVVLDDETLSNPATHTVTFPNLAGNEGMMAQGPWRWELLQGCSFSWNHATQEFDYIEHNKNEAGDWQDEHVISALHDRQLLERTVGVSIQGSFREELITCGTQRLEVRPVLAVRR